MTNCVILGPHSERAFSKLKLEHVVIEKGQFHHERTKSDSGAAVEVSLSVSIHFMHSDSSLPTFDFGNVNRATTISCLVRTIGMCASQLGHSNIKIKYLFVRSLFMLLGDQDLLCKLITWLW